MSKKILILDGSSLLHRAFYAMPLLTNAKGQFTNAVYGFAMMFNKLIKDQQPDYLAVCLDKSRISFRTEYYAEYKATRSETPPELSCQFELFKEYLAAAGAACLEEENYEADDLLGTLARKAKEHNCQALLITGDKDILQLIDENTTVYLTKKGVADLQKWDEAVFREKYKLSPKQMTDLKGLMGDSSDNIPGVKGVGEKTALKLLWERGSIESLYENIEQLPANKLKEKLLAERERAFLSKRLATIVTDAPVCAWESLVYSGANSSRLEDFYRQMGFKSLLSQHNKKQIILEQPSLFVLNTDEAPWPQARIDNQAVYSNIQALSNLQPTGGPLALVLRYQGPARLGRVIAVAVAEKNQGFFLTETEEYFPEVLLKLLADEKVEKIIPQTKEAFEVFSACGIKTAGKFFDPTVAAYLLDPSASDYNLNSIAEAVGVEPKADLPDFVGDAFLALAVFAPLADKLASEQMTDLFNNIEMPLTEVLAEMEKNGISAGAEALNELGREYGEKMLGLAQEIYDLAGGEFNLNSPKQLSQVLFEKLKIPPIKKTKTGYSTDSEVLEQLKESYPIADKVLQYRSYSKLKSTYTDSLVSLIDPCTGRIHTSFKQTVTATGRLSSVEPNLQNIPIREEQGRKIRSVFTAGKRTNALLAADYNQIELRVLAHISGDEKLLTAFREGEDIHRRTAAEVFGVEPNAVSPTQRRQAKAVNFGIVYGISDYGLSRDLAISRKQADEYIKLYFARYPKVAEYQKKTIEQGRLNGYVSTMFGRRRPLDDLNNRNFNLRSFAERMAVNTPIQGTAADIIKIAMVNIYRDLLPRFPECRLLLQVHDELIFEVPKACLKEFAALVKQYMEQAVSLDLPLIADLQSGDDWYNMEKLKV